LEPRSSNFSSPGFSVLVTYIGVDGVSALLNVESAVTGEIVRSGAASFLYLEVLDASFSFDGVIGAFALSNNLFIIAIGLGIGAMFVRSLTIMLVERETLACYRYLEHGAFYAIIVLALMMFLSTVQHIPEVVTGLVGAGFIVTSVSSIRSATIAALLRPRRALTRRSNGEIEKVQSLQDRPVDRFENRRSDSRPESRLSECGRFSDHTIRADSISAASTAPKEFRDGYKPCRATR
jgi:hypothetical protein